MASNLKSNGIQQNGVDKGRANDVVGKHLMKNGSHRSMKRQKFLNNVSQSTSRLPVHSHKGAFFNLLNENQTLLVIGETGSGKTTQIPQWCLEYCKRKTKQSGVACTQPRRIAAMSVAERVAKEMNVTLGQEVGYSVRFEACTSETTRLKYMTDGMLLREAMLDGMLTCYGVIILDEAHERTLQTEILFGVIKRALAARNNSDISHLPPVKVVIMSATINVKLFKNYFNSPVLHIEGRQHPVQEFMTEVPQSDLLTSTLICVFQIHRTSDEGDILVFCSGQDEIQSLITLTKKVLLHAPDNLKNLTPLPLYASLPAVSQMKVFDCNNLKAQTNGKTNNTGDSLANNHESFTRRVIFATNVAETSITIPNIKYVIDTGKVKCRSYCPKTGLESLKVTTISRAQARQRSGRAGRVAPGTCYRLYTNEDYAQFSDYLAPEIKRCNLDGVILQMISIGIKDLSSFDFLEKPDECRIKAALINLLRLKAIKPSATLTTTTTTTTPTKTEQSQTTSKDNQQPKGSMNFVSEDNSIVKLSYELTSIGKKLSAFPLSPSMSRIILAANELDCLDEALTVVSILSVESLFHIPPTKQAQAESILQKFHTNEGDLVMMLKVFRAFKKTMLLNKKNLKNWLQEHFIHLKSLSTVRLIRKQLVELCKTLGMQPSTSCGQDTTILRRALTYGLFNNVATMWDGKYRTKSSNDIHIHPSSCLFKMRPENVLYVEIVETNKCYMRHCTLIDINWVREVSASNIKTA